MDLGAIEVAGGHALDQHYVVLPFDKDDDCILHETRIVC